MDVDTDVLRWFQQVVDGMTLTEVADIDMVSQPAVSRALARLEDEVGTALLHKSGRILRPTQAGNVFKRHVDAAMHNLGDGLAALSELLDPETGTVNLSFQLSLGTWLVPAIIGRFRKEHPRVQFRLEHSEDASGSSTLADGAIDLEFTARRPNDPDIGWQRLFAQPLLLAIPDGHALAGRDAVALAEVAQENFVMLRSTWALRSVTEHLCESAGFSPRVAFECDDLAVVRGFVSAGLGIAVVPAPYPARRTLTKAKRSWIPITDIGAQRDVGLAWSLSRRPVPSVGLFREYVLSRPNLAALTFHDVG